MAKGGTILSSRRFEGTSMHEKEEEVGERSRRKSNHSVPLPTRPRSARHPNPEINPCHPPTNHHHLLNKYPPSPYHLQTIFLIRHTPPRNLHLKNLNEALLHIAEKPRLSAPSDKDSHRWQCGQIGGVWNDFWGWYGVVVVE